LRRVADSHAAPSLSELPAAAQGCDAPRAWSGGWRPELQSPDFSLSGSYSCRGEPVNVFIAGYFRNTQGKELVSEENRPVPREWRRFTQTGTNRFDTAKGRSVEVNEVLVDRGDASAVIWYWYSVGDRTATRPAVVKATQALEIILNGRSDGAIYWLETPFRATPAALHEDQERLAAVAREIEAARTRETSGGGGGA
jgi:EpsI family protein